MSTRKRLSPEQSRRAAVVAARTLLIEAGPQAVTLKAVAARIGRTHANLLHHFGSAAELQKALAAHLAAAVCETIGEAVRATQVGLGSPRQVVDLAFDAFGREGGAALASWMLLSGNEGALDPIVEAIHGLVDELHPHEKAQGAKRTMHETTQALVLLALGDALIGERLAQSLGVPRETVREKATALLTRSYIESGVLSADEAAS